MHPIDAVFTLQLKVAQKFYTISQEEASYFRVSKIWHAKLINCSYTSFFDTKIDLARMYE